jgi:hypothetical protein
LLGLWGSRPFSSRGFFGNLIINDLYPGFSHSFSPPAAQGTSIAFRAFQPNGPVGVKRYLYTLVGKPL